MKSEVLLPFYFGTLDESSRLLVERELLTDPEILVEYLDLKRALESAAPVPQLSSNLWSRLRYHAKRPKPWLITFSVGAALAAGVFLFVLFFKERSVETRFPHEILFDLNSELPASTHVL